MSGKRDNTLGGLVYSIAWSGRDDSFTQVTTIAEVRPLREFSCVQLWRILLKFSQRPLIRSCTENWISLTGTVGAFPVIMDTTLGSNIRMCVIVLMARKEGRRASHLRLLEHFTSHAVPSFT